VLAELKKLTDLPIRYIINADAGRDFVGGNEKLAKAGFTIFTNALGNTGFVGSMTNGGAAAILAHESVLTRMTKENYPAAAAPTEAFYAARKPLRMNDEGLEVLYQPQAHSGADSFVLFRGSDVVVTGDVLDTTRFPIIDVANGGSINGEIDALNRLIDLTIAPTPFIYKDVGTYVVPGHGRLSEQMEVVEYRDMVVIMRDRIADLITKKKTLADIKAARPGLPYETRYGAKTGAWTTDMFIEAVHKSLTAK
jgi:cyclase